MYPLLNSIILAVCFMFNANIGFAHSLLEQQIPARNTTVTSPPEVRLIFSEPLEPAFCRVMIFDANNQQIDTAKAIVDATTAKVLTLPLPLLTAGIYTVKWSVVSTDGHRTKNSYQFTVH
jgi:methionine-rich copper-binding protein CopC